LLYVFHDIVTDLESKKSPKIAPLVASLAWFYGARDLRSLEAESIAKVYTLIRSMRLVAETVSMSFATGYIYYVPTETISNLERLELSATDFAFIIHHTSTVPEQTKDNTISLGLRDVTWRFRGCLRR